MDSEFDLNAARQNLKRATLEKRAREKKLYEQALEDAEKILRMIAEKYRPERVWQWGSLLHPESFRDYSDIDIALEGLPDAETFFNLYGDAMKLTDFPLDIVEMDKIEPEFADCIRMKGKIVYEKQG